VLERHGRQTVEARFERFRSQVASGKMTGGFKVESGEDLVDLPGLADVAYWSQSWRQLWMLKKGRAVVTINFPSEPKNLGDPMAAARKLAEKVAPRL
jgi:hypothetical protein